MAHVGSRLQGSVPHRSSRSSGQGSDGAGSGLDLGYYAGGHRGPDHVAPAVILAADPVEGLYVDGVGNGPALVLFSRPVALAAHAEHVAVAQQPASSIPGARARNTPPVTATMIGMSPFSLRHDVRLGLLLLVAALLLDMGSSGGSWFSLVFGQLDRTARALGLLGLVGGLGSLFVVLAAIWVDRRPPHGMMAAGAVILALGLVLVTLARSFGPALAGLFLVGAGGSAFSSLVFYAIVVKGYARFKGTLIGALGLVFAANPGAGAIRNWDFGIPVGWFALVLVLIGGMVLYIFLPRWFRGTYGPGPALRETIALPGVKARSASAAAVYLAATTIFAAGSTHLLWVAAASVGAAYDARYQALALAVGIGALVWGVAADFFSVRWLLIALAVLSLPAAACVWLLDDPFGGALLLSLVRGGLVSLPWVLMANLLPERHFAKLALAIALLGVLGRSLGPLYQGATMGFWGTGSFIWIALIESVVLAGAVAWRPTDGGIGSWTRWWNKRAPCEERRLQ